MAEFVDGISDEEVIKRLKEYVKNQLGSENRYKITDCHFHNEGWQDTAGIEIECQVLYKRKFEEDGMTGEGFCRIGMHDLKELCHISKISFDASGFNTWTVYGALRLDYSKLDYSSYKIAEKLDDYVDGDDWNYEFIDEANWIEVVITPDEYSSDREDVPSIKRLNQKLESFRDDINSKEYPFGEEED